MENLEAKTINELTHLYNEMVLTAADLAVPAKTIKKFKDKPSALARVKALDGEIRKFKKTPVERKKRKSGIEPTAKITVMVENPKRAKAKERFALYRDGMLVATYMEKVGDKQALADIRWDLKKKFIKLASE